MKSIKQKELSIIIVSYNTKQITVDCISSIFESLQGSNLNIEVIIVDNGSTDGSVEELKRLQVLYPQIRIFLNKENIGFGKANNMGVSKANAETILLLNSDIIVLNNAIYKLYRFFTTHQYEFAGGKLLNQDMTPQASAGSFFTIWVTFAFLFLKGDSLGITRSSPRIIKQVDWVSGACIITTKENYQELNGFDEGIFMYMEEVDLLYRAARNKMQTVFFPDAQFIHLGSASSNKTYPILQVYSGLRYFYKKHYPRHIQLMLQYMLQLKASVSLIIGKLTKNAYLTKTYGEAYKIAKMV